MVKNEKLERIRGIKKALVPDAIVYSPLFLIASGIAALLEKEAGGR